MHVSEACERLQHGHRRENGIGEQKKMGVAAWPGASGGSGFLFLPRFFITDTFSNCQCCEPS
jgi:hypothetical protein